MLITHLSIVQPVAWVVGAVIAWCLLLRRPSDLRLALISGTFFLLSVFCRIVFLWIERSSLLLDFVLTRYTLIIGMFLIGVFFSACMVGFLGLGRRWWRRGLTSYKRVAAVLMLLLSSLGVLYMLFLTLTTIASSLSLWRGAINVSELEQIECIAWKSFREKGAVPSTSQLRATLDETDVAHGENYTPLASNAYAYAFSKHRGILVFLGQKSVFRKPLRFDNVSTQSLRRAYEGAIDEAHAMHEVFEQ